MRKNSAAVCLCLSVGLAGCASSGPFDGGTTGKSSGSGGGTTNAASSIIGVVQTAGHPVVGAHVHLMKINSGGWGQAAISLVNDTGLTDSVGGYAVTGSDGSYAIPSTYTCADRDMTYLYVSGGTESGQNSGAGFLAPVGSCPLQAYNGTETILINEITTIATAYGLGGYGSDPVHSSYSGSTLAFTGLENAFLNTVNLYTTGNGQLLQTTPAGNGQVPFKAINTLANILAACNGSTSAASAACSKLFANTASASGTVPTDAAMALANIMHNPAANVAALYSMAANGPYGPILAMQPNDFTLGVNYTGGGLNAPGAVAIDSTGEVWFANLGDSTVSKFSTTGVALSPAKGFVNGNPIGPVGITVDLSGNAWIVNAIASSLIKYAPSGALLSPTPGYIGAGMVLPEGVATDALGNIWTANYFNGSSKFANNGTAISASPGYQGGGISHPVAVAIDSSGSVWLGNSGGDGTNITELSSAGAPLSPATGYTGGGLNKPFGLAIDNNGMVWTANFLGNSISKFSPMGEPLSPSTGFTGGGLSLPFSVAVDGAGNVWAANSGIYSVSEFSANGTPISPATGFTGGTMASPQAIAVDGSGNVWIANFDDISITVLLGAATPVVTPLAQGIKYNTLGARP